MGKSFTERKRIRKNFGRLHEITQIPNLIEVQKHSYDAFLQMHEAPEKREDVGMEGVFKSVFPIKDYSGRAQLEYVKYQFDKPKYDVDECRQRGTTYGAPLKVTLRLVVWDVDETTGARSVHDIKEQDVYMGDMPLMTNNGTFVINGTERVIVSQMHRSPGVFFDHDQGKTHASGKFLFAARIIPYRGSWLDFEFDGKDILNVRIDRRRKLPVTTFLMALTNNIHESMIGESANQPIDPEEPGMTAEEILTTFYDTLTFSKAKNGWKTRYIAEKMRGLRLAFDLVDAKTGKVVAEAGTKMTPRLCRKLAEEGLKERIAPSQELIGHYCAVDLINEKTGEVFVESGDELTEEIITVLEKAGIKEIPILAIDHINVGAYLRNTLVADRSRTREEALMDIYRVMRPGEPPTYEAADALFRSLFFDPERYDLSAVGRVKMNARLGLDCSDALHILRKEDVIAILKVLLGLKDGRGEVDDIDHLGNRRVRSVGELLENQYRMGLVRMERAVRERLSSVEIETAMPNDLINAKPAISVLREFFGSSQLSQFMDQTNPLSEITHKRRVSALGPGGLTRERAGFEVRDVHPTHYGRICPIETPEGPNIGLINSLATYARVNQYGFIETPYRTVADGVVQDDVIYLNAIEEGKYTIAQANAELNDKQLLTSDLVSSRHNSEFVMVRPEDVNYIDVSPKQVVSVAAALIPFLENDDANRALMGSNMQRQAVPLVHCEAPLVGTGMEAVVARDSGTVVVARRSGVVDQVDGNRIVVRVGQETASTESGVDIYNLRKFQRSNQNTCINQRPLVKAKDIVEKGDIIADGPATDLGELALGRNVLCAFMPWNGYNYEDSILISEKLVRDDVFTSIHIEEFEVMARDTKLGAEEITRDIPNVGDEVLRNLDETGIVYVGAEVRAGDILVGKVTPKGEGLMTAEEKLLRAIFGEKAADVRDTSLHLPPGVSGTVVEVRVFTRRGIEKDERSIAIERVEIESLAKDRDAEKAILERNFAERLRQDLEGQKCGKGVEGIKAGKILTAEELKELTLPELKKISIADDKTMEKIETLKHHYQNAIKEIEDRFADKVDKVQRGDDLPPGVLKMIKVFVAVKRKLQPGDKMAGRHGNKGVISRIVPVEDMPYLDDGTPVDMVLNPLGVPSRMNVGQILETHLGWACAGIGQEIGALVDQVAQKRSGVTAKDLEPLKKELQQVYGEKTYKKDIAKLSTPELVELGQNLRSGIPIASPVFDGAKEENILQFLEKAGLDVSGQVTLYDGCTGEALSRKVTVGYIYMLKLHHLVDEKIHARSIGPYSLVTQQPLGGKAQFGGQRFGEMEVWALEAYGAAYTLQEMLTIKSDDVAGRTKVYEAIVRGDENFEAGIPESFNVLVKELQSLGLNVEMLQED